MNTRTRLATAFLALAATSVAAQASDKPLRGDGERATLRFERIDTDKSGDVTFEEFVAVMDERFAGADADGDGRMTVAEIADRIERARVERMARRIVERLDTDGDGALTAEEVKSSRQKLFARLDRNEDGKLVADEMPKRGMLRP
jgi:Ca2+-binding EF-hand superfamily protein